VDECKPLVKGASLAAEMAMDLDSWGAGADAAELRAGAYTPPILSST